MDERSRSAKEDVPFTGEQTIQRLSFETKYAADQLGKTVKEVRRRTSLDALKRQGRERLHEMAVEKPKHAARTVGTKTADLSRQTGAFLKDQPVIPVILSALVLGALALLRGRS